MGMVDGHWIDSSFYARDPVDLHSQHLDGSWRHRHHFVDHNVAGENSNAGSRFALYVRCGGWTVDRAQPRRF